MQMWKKVCAGLLGCSMAASVSLGAAFAAPEQADAPKNVQAEVPKIPGGVNTGNVVSAPAVQQPAVQPPATQQPASKTSRSWLTAYLRITALSFSLRIRKAMPHLTVSLSRKARMPSFLRSSMPA